MMSHHLPSAVENKENTSHSASGLRFPSSTTASLSPSHYITPPNLYSLESVSGESALLSILHYLQTIPNPAEALRENAVPFSIALGLHAGQDENSLRQSLEALFLNILVPSTATQSFPPQAKMLALPPPLSASYERSFGTPCHFNEGPSTTCPSQQISATGFLDGLYTATAEPLSVPTSVTTGTTKPSLPVASCNFTFPPPSIPFFLPTFQPPHIPVTAQHHTQEWSTPPDESGSNETPELGTRSMTALEGAVTPPQLNNADGLALPHDKPPAIPLVSGLPELQRLPSQHQKTVIHNSLFKPIATTLGIKEGQEKNAALPQCSVSDVSKTILGRNIETQYGGATLVPRGSLPTPSRQTDSRATPLGLPSSLFSVLSQRIFPVQDPGPRSYLSKSSPDTFVENTSTQAPSETPLLRTLYTVLSPTIAHTPPSSAPSCNASQEAVHAEHSASSTPCNPTSSSFSIDSAITHCRSNNTCTECSHAQRITGSLSSAPKDTASRPLNFAATAYMPDASAKSWKETPKATTENPAPLVYNASPRTELSTSAATSQRPPTGEAQEQASPSSTFRLICGSQVEKLALPGALQLSKALQSKNDNALAFATRKTSQSGEMLCTPTVTNRITRNNRPSEEELSEYTAPQHCEQSKKRYNSLFCSQDTSSMSTAELNNPILCIGSENEIRKNKDKDHRSNFLKPPVLPVHGSRASPGSPATSRCSAIPTEEPTPAASPIWAHFLSLHPEAQSCNSRTANGEDLSSPKNFEESSVERKRSQPGEDTTPLLGHSRDPPGAPYSCRRTEHHHPFSTAPTSKLFSAPLALEDFLNDLVLAERVALSKGITQCSEALFQAEQTFSTASSGFLPKLDETQCPCGAGCTHSIPPSSGDLKLRALAHLNKTEDGSDKKAYTVCPKSYRNSLSRYSPAASPVGSPVKDKEHLSSTTPFGAYPLGDGDSKARSTTLSTLVFPTTVEAPSEATPTKVLAFLSALKHVKETTLSFLESCPDKLFLYFAVCILQEFPLFKNGFTSSYSCPHSFSQHEDRKWSCASSRRAMKHTSSAGYDCPLTHQLNTSCYSFRGSGISKTSSVQDHSKPPYSPTPPSLKKFSRTLQHPVGESAATEELQTRCGSATSSIFRPLEPNDHRGTVLPTPPPVNSPKVMNGGIEAGKKDVHVEGPTQHCKEKATGEEIPCGQGQQSSGRCQLVNSVENANGTSKDHKQEQAEYENLTATYPKQNACSPCLPLYTEETIRNATMPDIEANPTGEEKRPSHCSSPLATPSLLTDVIHRDLAPTLLNQPDAAPPRQRNVLHAPDQYASGQSAKVPLESGPRDGSEQSVLLGASSQTAPLSNLSGAGGIPPSLYAVSFLNTPKPHHTSPLSPPSSSHGGSSSTPRQCNHVASSSSKHIEFPEARINSSNGSKLLVNSTRDDPILQMPDHIVTKTGVILPPPDSRLYLSRVVGVVWDKIHNSWVVNYTLMGRRYFQHFPAKRYGFLGGRQLAIDLRLAKDREKSLIEGTLRSGGRRAQGPASLLATGTKCPNRHSQKPRLKRRRNEFDLQQHRKAMPASEADHLSSRTATSATAAPSPSFSCSPWRGDPLPFQQLPAQSGLFASLSSPAGKSTSPVQHMTWCPPTTLTGTVSSFHTTLPVSTPFYGSSSPLTDRGAVPPDCSRIFELPESELPALLTYNACAHHAFEAAGPMTPLAEERHASSSSAPRIPSTQVIDAQYQPNQLVLHSLMLSALPAPASHPPAATPCAGAADAAFRSFHPSPLQKGNSKAPPPSAVETLTDNRLIASSTEVRPSGNASASSGPRSGASAVVTSQQPQQA